MICIAVGLAPLTNNCIIKNTITTSHFLVSPFLQTLSAVFLQRVNYNGISLLLHNSRQLVCCSSASFNAIIIVTLSSLIDLIVFLFIYVINSIFCTFLHHFLDFFIQSISFLPVSFLYFTTGLFIWLSKNDFLSMVETMDLSDFSFCQKSCHM